MEPSRSVLLKKTIDHLITHAPPWWFERMTWVDNASTQYDVIDEQMKRLQVSKHRIDRNVGYWSAIDWWLTSLAVNPPEYTYIVESDMLHNNAAVGALELCVECLDAHPELGAVRLHEYSIEDCHLYDKDKPVEGSHRNIWQTHTNKATGERIAHERVDEGPLWRTNFLTQLPALNRYGAMAKTFESLRVLGKFTEFDFQRLYHALYPEVAVHDGGIFTCKACPNDGTCVTGSWTSPAELVQQGYYPPRNAFIVPRDQYTVTLVG